MAEYFTHFCVELKGLKTRQRQYWEKHKSHVDDDGEECGCFDVSIEDGRVFLSADAGFVTMDHVAAELRKFLSKFRVKTPIIVPYANTASRSLPDAFDGGVVVVWAGREVWLNASAAGEAIAAGKAVEPVVHDFSTPLDELDDSTR